MLNLIVNAGEAIPSGRKGTIRIWADTKIDARVIRLGVTDNGIGMSRDTQRRAMDLFFTTKFRSMGTGLGLPLARKVALRAGGDLLLSSQVGKGTTVILELPAINPAAGLGAGPTAPQRRAVISVANVRTAALIGQVLLGVGLELNKSSARGPGTADFWVTDPTINAAEAALRWRKRRPAGVIAVVGQPLPRLQKRWAALGAIIISRDNEISSIRQALGQALASL